MRELAAYGTFALTLGLALARPRLGRLRLSPALAALLGALVLAGAGFIDGEALVDAADTLWRPMIALASLMVIAGVAEHAGAFAWLAEAAARGAGGRARALFDRTFVLAAAGATLLNNDVAVLMLTPVVIALVRRLYPERPALHVAFALAVFAAAGVAALPISNPMNLVVAYATGIDFLAYAAVMTPVAFAAWLATWAALRVVFARILADAGAPRSDALPAPATPAPAARAAIAVGAIVAALYAPVAALGGPIWVVTAAGALAALALAARHRVGRAGALVRRSVDADTLVFLVAVFLLGAGLRNAGLVDRVASLYAGAGLDPLVIGASSAIGSATINNHPMAIVNMLALEELGAGANAVLAALIGGDLGPRLLPVGSLAGLIWLGALRRQGVEVGVGRFCAVGLATAVPALAAALLVLAAVG